MSSFHKIFFVGVVILSVAFGSHFNGAKNTNGNKVASIIISAADAAPAAENLQPAGAAQPATSNDSTTSNDIKDNGQADVSAQSQDDNSKTALDNGALLKPDMSSVKDAFHLTGSAQPPEIQAEAAMIADLKTGRAYFELNRNSRRPMSSLAKLMTAAMVLKNMDLSKPVKTVNEQSSTYSGNDMLNTMLVTSKDEVAEALAGAYGRNDFIAGLNSLAGEFGMNSTNFSDPTGLSVSDQSTIADLQKLAMSIYQNYPKIFEITGKKSVTVTELASKKKIKLSNTNNLAGTAGFIGGETGYGDDENGNILSVFSYANRPVLVTVLGANDRFGETKKLIDWFKGNYR